MTTTGVASDEPTERPAPGTDVGGRLGLVVVAAAEVVVLAATAVVVFAEAPPAYATWLFVGVLTLNVVAVAAVVVLELRPRALVDDEPRRTVSPVDAGGSEDDDAVVADAHAERARAQALGEALHASRRARLVGVVVATAGVSVVGLVVMRVQDDGSGYPLGTPPEYILDGRYVDPDWPPLDDSVPGDGGGGELDPRDRPDLPDAAPRLSRTADVFAAQVAELAFGTLLEEGVATTSELRTWLADRGGNAVDAAVGEFVKGASAQIWAGGDEAVDQIDLQASETGVPAICDGVALEVERLLEARLPGRSGDDAAVREDVAVYLRQQLCPVLVLVRPASTGTAPTAPDVPTTLVTDRTSDGKDVDRDTRGGRVEVVERGDSLWTIVERRLPEASDDELARRWRSLWSTNRGLIGPDPDLIEPGMRLRVP